MPDRIVRGREGSMKRLCLAIWAALSLLLGGLAAQALWEAPSLSNGCYLLLVGYYAFCFLQLILAFFRPWGLLGPRRRTGYWLCLILLPLDRKSTRLNSS